MLRTVGSLNECKQEARETAEVAGRAISVLGYQVKVFDDTVLVADGLWAIMTEYPCLPETVDPRTANRRIAR